MQTHTYILTFRYVIAVEHPGFFVHNEAKSDAEQETAKKTENKKEDSEEMHTKRANKSSRK